MVSNPFASASGHGNLPGGVFSPDIFSKNTIIGFRRVSVAMEVTNTEYEGEIASMGDTVRILKEPAITVQDYERGTKLQYTDLIDEETTLVIDQGKAYGFLMDDIETAQGHVDFASMGVDNASYQLRDTFDSNVLTNMADNATTTAGTGVSSTPVTVGYDAGDDFTPMNIINRLARLMDENDVPEDGGRFVVATPGFFEFLAQEDSKLIDIHVTGDAESMARQRKLGTSRPLHGFTLWKSNNLSNSAGGDVRILAGHLSATAVATQITKSEVIRDNDSFADKYRGLLVFGRKVLRPEALFVANITLS